MISTALFNTVSSTRVRTDVLPVVHVVDDDVSIRESLAGLINSAGWQAESFSCAADYLACSCPAGPACLLLDVSLPDLSGLELLQRLAAQGSGLPVVMMSGHGDVPTTVRAMKAGAFDFVTKPVDETTLLAAIEQAIERSRVALREDADLRALHERFASLTRREREVMEGVVIGRLNKQVAADLDISEITVKAHRGRMMQKMRARTLPDLVNMAARLGITKR